MRRSNSRPRRRHSGKDRAELGKEIAALKLAKLVNGMNSLITEVEVSHKAVDWALRYDELDDLKQTATAYYYQRVPLFYFLWIGDF